jgi:hypothetical protein
MFDPAIGKVTMRATVEWFKKEKFHWKTLMLHTHAEEKRVRVSPPEAERAQAGTG